MAINHAQKIKSLFWYFLESELGILVYFFFSVFLPGLGEETLSNLWKVLPMYRSPFEVRVNEIFFEPLKTKAQVISYLRSGFTGD